MFTMLTVIRKRPEVTTERFRHFMEHEYGVIYAKMAEVREYEQFYLADAMTDGAEPAIDAIVRISFESKEQMASALESDAYREAHRLREAFMQPTSRGIHSAVVERVVKFV